MRSTRVERHINASRPTVYRLLIDPVAVAHWRVPDDMTAEVHVFEPREGGAVHVSLTYDAPTNSGKTSAHTDTYHGRFIRLIPDEQVVEANTFDTEDANMRGEMISTITLSDAPDGGTRVVALHQNLPPALSLRDNETGWRMAFERLADLAERAETASGSSRAQR